MLNFKQPIVINGTGGAGKDEFILQAKSLLSGSALDIYTYSAVDQVKQWAIQMGWDGKTKSPEARSLLFKLKMLSVEFNDGPTRYLMDRIQNIDSGLVFLHVREPEEIMKLKGLVPELKLLHIERPGIEILKNGADDRTRELEYDYEINNDQGIDELRLKCGQFIETILPDEIKRELRKSGGEFINEFGKLR